MEEDIASLPPRVVRLTQPRHAQDIDEARTLFTEYSAWLGVNLCFQNFEKELAELPGAYVPPTGRLLLAIENEQVVGCVALRRLEEGTGEMKRLYVRPEFRGKGLGRILTDAIIAAAREVGYQRLRLDTLPGRMDRAIGMYRSLGFRDIEKYYDNPYDTAAYMELILDR